MFSEPKHKTCPYEVIILSQIVWLIVVKYIHDVKADLGFKVNLLKYDLGMI